MESQNQNTIRKQSSHQTNQPTNFYDYLVKLTWLLAALAIIACLKRNDYNVLFSFFILVVLHNFYNENSFFYIKSLIHLTLVIIFVDVIWLIIIIPFWNTKYDNQYWKSLSGIHSFTVFIAFLELFVKIAILVLNILDFRKYYGEQYKRLLDFNYNDASPKIVVSKFICLPNLY